MPPYLTDEELYEICRPRRQGAAQIRFLRSLGIKVERRADGTPLVWRRDVEAPMSGSPGVEPQWRAGRTTPTASGINWAAVKK